MNSPPQPEPSSPPRESLFAALPSVSAIIAEAGRQASPFRGEALTRLAADALEFQRHRIAAGVSLTRAEVMDAVLASIADLETPKLRPLINATGVIIHTNLGRAQVSPETAQAMAEAAGHAVALEIDPRTNERGGRMNEISRLMSALTGAEAALVVNNCASALLLTLSALTTGRGVAVSRGEAVEIGGGYRVPEVMLQSGAILVEVGTTNRTYAQDYSTASGDIAAFLKVHLSNFRIEGFTHAATVEDLVAAAKAKGVPLLEDLGSGALIDTTPFGLHGEPTVGSSVAAGVDVVMFSGDKLLGGPQGGFIVGRQELISRIERHPLARAVRADKVTLAGMAQTLRHYACEDAMERVPVWRMISADVGSLRVRAHALQSRLNAEGRFPEVIETKATVGGGSLPGETLPSVGLVVASGSGIDLQAQSLRLASPGVFPRIESGNLVVDLRTVLAEQDDDLFHALIAFQAS